MPSEQQIKKQKKYEQYVKSITPSHSLPVNMLKAFVTGGLICLFGQWILNTAQTMGADRETAGNWCSLILIFLSVLLTGLNLYSKIGKFGGAGGLVPITGFANSVASSAIEFQAEGQILTDTSAKFICRYPSAPMKITSSIFEPRMVFDESSPRTHLIASVIFDFPLPFGPTIIVDP